MILTISYGFPNKKARVDLFSFKNENLQQYKKPAWVITIWSHMQASEKTIDFLSGFAYRFGKWRVQP